MQMIKSKLAPLGHQVHHETVKNHAIDRLKKEAFDMIFLDPSPLLIRGLIVLNIDRSVSNYPYVMLRRKVPAVRMPCKVGTNDISTKPFLSDRLEEKINKRGTADCSCQAYRR